MLEPWRNPTRATAGELEQLGPQAWARERQETLEELARDIAELKRLEAEAKRLQAAESGVFQEVWRKSSIEIEDGFDPLDP